MIFKVTPVQGQIQDGYKKEGGTRMSTSCQSTQASNTDRIFGPQSKYYLWNSLQELVLNLDPRQSTEGWYLNVDESQPHITSDMATPQTPNL